MWTIWYALRMWWCTRGVSKPPPTPRDNTRRIPLSASSGLRVDLSIVASDETVVVIRKRHSADSNTTRRVRRRVDSDGAVARLVVTHSGQPGRLTPADLGAGYVIITGEGGIQCLYRDNDDLLPALDVP